VAHTNLLIAIWLMLVNGGLAGSRFHSQEGGYTVEIPSGWKCEAVDHLPLTSKHNGKNQRDGHATVVCTPQDSNDIEPPVVFILTKRLPVGENHIEGKLSSDEAQDVLRNNPRGRLEAFTSAVGWKPNWAEAEVFDYRSEYDRLTHRNVERLLLTSSELVKMEVGVVNVLGNRRITTLQYYHDDGCADSALDSIERIVSSFRYDQGSGYGESWQASARPEANNNAITQAKARLTISILVLAGTILLCLVNVGLQLMKKGKEKVPSWINRGLSLWYPVFGSFILVIAVYCGYLELWLNFGVALMAASLFFIRGFLYPLIEGRGVSHIADDKEVS